MQDPFVFVRIQKYDIYKIYHHEQWPLLVCHENYVFPDQKISVLSTQNKYHVDTFTDVLTP